MKSKIVQQRLLLVISIVPPFTKSDTFSETTYALALSVATELLVNVFEALFDPRIDERTEVGLPRVSIKAEKGANYPHVVLQCIRHITRE